MANSEKIWDVIVVGAGPGGASAAYFLGRAGVDVLLLDKESFPRDKTCGDGCTPRTARMLEKMGVREQVAAEYPHIRRARLISPGGVLLDSAIPESIFGGVGYAVPRLVLDNFLFEKAVGAGAEFRPGKSVRGVQREGEVSRVIFENGPGPAARIVIGADGAYSAVRRSLGRERNKPKHLAWAVRVYYEDVDLVAPDAFEICWDSELLPAYGWLFPVGEGKANVGLGLRGDHLAKLGRKLPDLFEEFLARDPYIGAEVRGARRVGKPRGHLLPFGSECPKSYGEGVLLVGDAASFINPLTGEGIEFALESGEIAAQVALDALGDGDFSARRLAAYERGWRAAFGHTLRANYRLQWFFRMPSMVDRIFRVAGEDERTKEELAHLILGEKPRISLRLVWKFLFG